jgi:hypothetical protein
MKHLLIPACLVVCLLLVATANAATVTLAWDPAPAGQAWQKIRIYEKGATGYTLVTEVAGDAATAQISVIPGAHSWVARSYDGIWESGDSNAVTTGPVPAAPGGLRIGAVLAAVGGVIGMILMLAFLRKAPSR